MSPVKQEGGFQMPVYDYICLDCKVKKEVRATLKEKEEGLKPVCDSCGSDKMTQFFGNMAVIKSYPLH